MGETYCFFPVGLSVIEVCRHNPSYSICFTIKKTTLIFYMYYFRNVQQLPLHNAQPSIGQIDSNQIPIVAKLIAQGQSISVSIDDQEISPSTSTSTSKPVTISSGESLCTSTTVANIQHAPVRIFSFHAHGKIFIISTDAIQVKKFQWYLRNFILIVLSRILLDTAFIWHASSICSFFSNVFFIAITATMILSANQPTWLP